MSSFAIVLGFAMMLFLPCAVALIGSRDPQQEPSSVYADRLVDQSNKPALDEAAAAPNQAATPAMQAPAPQPIATARVVDQWGDLRDPLAPSRGPRPHHGRIAHAEIEALKARAVAARAHAEALAAVARAAAARAEAADADAYALEQDAAQAIQDMRRAA
jgi:hypothetical protein